MSNKGLEIKIANNGFVVTYKVSVGSDYTNVYDNSFIMIVAIINFLLLSNERKEVYKKLKELKYQ